MTEISRVALFGKLNRLGYQAIEGATVFCKMRGNPYVEIVHWMAQILQVQDNDVIRMIRHYDLDTGKIAADMTRALDALPRGSSTISDLSAHLENAMERAWVYGSALQFQSGTDRAFDSRSAQNPGIAQYLSGDFQGIRPDRCR